MVVWLVCDLFESFVINCGDLSVSRIPTSHLGMGYRNFSHNFIYCFTHSTHISTPKVEPGSSNHCTTQEAEYTNRFRLYVYIEANLWTGKSEYSSNRKFQMRSKTKNIIKESNTLGKIEVNPKLINFWDEHICLKYYSLLDVELYHTSL